MTAAWFAAVPATLLVALGLQLARRRHLRDREMALLPEHDALPLGIEAHRLTRTGRIDSGNEKRIPRPGLLVAGCSTWRAS